MIYQSATHDERYFPPILGNGDISLAVDCEGATHLPAKDYLPLEGFENVIYRAGRRQNVGHDRRPGELMSFGKLYMDIGSAVASFEQELKEDEGSVHSVCEYENGARIRTEAFIHPDHPLYCVRRTVEGDKAVSLTIRYDLCGYDKNSHEAIFPQGSSCGAFGGCVDFQMFGQDLYTGQIRLITDRPVESSCTEREVTMTCTLQPGESIALSLLVEDDLFTDSAAQANEQLAQKLAKLGFDGLMNETRLNWQAFYSHGYVRTSDEQLNSIYRTALYHLRCYTTRWSITVGLNEQSWHGKFFAFDEYYNFLGLLGANQWELAKRVPTFRLEVCLEKAIHRQTSQTEEQARFRWETSEYGEELSPPGFYYDHVFHMCVIALGAFEYYEYQQDREFLERCYRMIRACAKFFTLHMLYRDGDRVYLGRCTDLERLGSSVMNPFMTSCGAIATLEVTAKASEILGIDEEYRAECKELAQKLRETLPVENGMYVPYLGCPQKSIGVFSGKYPFNVIDGKDEKLQAAWKDFELNGGAFGNMYRMGKKLSPWYACWKAAGYARCGMAEHAYFCLRQSYESVGVFNEMFEINEPDKRLRPWFTTASGVFLCSVHDMLAQSDGETITLMPACPLKDVAMRLNVRGGAVLECEIKDGKLLSAHIEAKEPKTMKLVYGDTVMELKA